MDTDLAALLATTESMTAMVQDNLWLFVGVSIFSMLPPFLVLYSKKVSGSQKVLWFILTGIFSWLAYLPFQLIYRNAATEKQEPSE